MFSRWVIRKKIFFQKVFLTNKQDKITSMVIDKSWGWNFIGLSVKILVLAIFGSIIFFPFFFMISSSFFNLEESEKLISNESKLQIFPGKIGLENYKVVISNTSSFQSYSGAILASVVTTVLSVFARLFFVILLGYAFSLKKWKFKKLFWILFLSLLSIPEAGILAGQYVVAVNSQLSRELLGAGLVIPFVSSVFSGYLFRNAFENIPTRIREAAMIDGHSQVSYVFRVALPMVKPIIWTVVILTTFSAWNAYLWPNILIPAGKTYAFWKPINIWALSSGFDQTTDEPREIISYRMVSAVLATLPMMIVFFVFRKRIMKIVSNQGSTIKG